MRVGVFGGSFDPIHCGHLHVAKQAIHFLGLDKAVLMPARIPPHKQAGKVTSGYHRFAMAVIATREEEQIEVSTLELARSGPSYTVDTMALIRTLKKWEFCFIGGGDSLKEVHLWKDCAKLFRDNCLVFVPRPGVGKKLSQIEVDSGIRGRLQVLDHPGSPAILPGSAYFLELNSILAVSSSEIRGCLRKGMTPLESQLPTAVHQYIRKYRLYGPEDRSEEHL